MPDENILASMPTENPRTNSSNSQKRPVLSLILCSRSDQYQGNSRWRLQIALNYLGQTAHQLGREEDVEVIVADWGSEIPLRNVLELTQEAARIVSFLHIPPDIARVEQKDSPFPEVLALNAAARRANGEYIGRIDQDTLVTTHFLETFFWLHEKQRLLVPLESALLLSNRRCVPYRLAALCPHFLVVDRYIRWFGRFLPLMYPMPPHLFYVSFVGIWLLHRDIWYECGGYNEEFIYMDWQEAEMILRLTPKYTLVNLGELVNHDLYHLDHVLVDPLKPLRAGRNRKVNPSRMLDNRPEKVYPNSENWGLTQYPLEVLPYPRDQVNTNEVRSVWSRLRWLAFLNALLISSAQIAADHMVMGLRRATKRANRLAVIIKGKLNRLGVKGWWSFLAPSIWRHRLRVLGKTISGQPFVTWPRLLFERWMNRRSNRTGDRGV
jgi:hypothetical protein